MILKNALDALVSVVAPAPCRICSEPLLRASRIPICDSCLNSFTRIDEPLCRICGRPFVSPLAGQAVQPLCRLCRTNFFAFDRARSFAVYSGSLVEAILLLKYEQVTRLGDWFAAHLAELALEGQGDRKFDCVVPVPLYRDRLRERGYNQAELIARPLAKMLSLTLRPNLLVRVKPRPPQLMLSRSERWKIVRGAYTTQPGARVDKMRILLLDDVMTTGATVDACARSLKKAGASAVMGLTVGRMLPGASEP